MCMACIDTKKAEAFAENLIGVFNGGALSLMISIGYRTRLFDVLAEKGPLGSDGLAKAAGLNERYVREWLGAMVTGGILTVTPESGEYALPAEHATVLTRAASPDNLAVTAQFIPLLGQVEDQIVDCFKQGGGVSYEQFGRFHEVMADESNQTVVAGLEEHILPLVPSLKHRLQDGIDVLDVGCGSGHAMNALARAYPASRFHGYDFSEEAISNARREADARGIRNASFSVQDAARFDDSARFDLITAFDAIHDQAAPAAVLKNIRRALKPGGIFLMQDIKAQTPHHENIGNPLAPLLYTISTMHCMTVSLANDGEGLGAMWGRQKAESMLADAGFDHVVVRELEHDIMNYWYVARA